MLKIYEWCHLHPVLKCRELLNRGGLKSQGPLYNEYSYYCLITDNEYSYKLRVYVLAY